MSLAVKKFKIVKRILSNFILSENIIELILIQYWKLLPKNKILLECIDINKINWAFLSKNTNAIDLLKKQIEYENTLSKKEYDNLRYFKKIDWDYLSNNKNAITLLENNLDKIDWDELSSNINAIHILENNLDKINWEALSQNPSIFEDEPMPIV